MRVERGAESAAEVSLDRIEPDVLFGQSALVVNVEFAAALGFTDVGPVGGTVAGTGEAIRLDKGLQEQRAVPVARQPVARQPAAAACEQAGSEVFDLHPGQDQMLMLGRVIESERA